MADFDPHAVPVRPAATVMLVRDAEVDGAPGIEVFMLQRTMKAAFAAGAYVFPGGAVDPADGGAAAEAICVGRSDVAASRSLGIDTGGLAYWVAAVRECFEEAGVLLAQHADGSTVRFDSADAAARFAGHRIGVHANEGRFLDVVRDEGLRLSVGDIHYVSHWITPVGEVRRFDTRFFVAPAPAAQEPLHDDHETVASLWVSPSQALARMEARELFMIPPTIANIRYLARFSSTAEVLADAAAIASPPAILPRLVTTPEGKVTGVKLPGEPGYDELS
jgi:8-oxo-dGTP pyrophosphatase MutT (NUDIX family)